MIVDFRLRPPFGAFRDVPLYAKPERTELMGSALHMAPPPALRSRMVGDTLREMDEAGIDLAVVPVRRGDALGDVSNDEVAAFVSEHSGRFVSFAAPDLSKPQAALDEMRALAERPEFYGMCFEPGLWSTPLYADDRSLYPLYDLCSQLELPALIMGGGNAGPDITYTAPVLLDHVCADFPRLTVVAAHGGWPWVNEILHVAYRRTNLYLSPDMYLFGMAGWRDYVDAGNGFLQDRFIFGTAYPVVPLAEGVTRFRALFDERVLPRLLGENALRVLRIDQAQRDGTAQLKNGDAP